MNNAFLKVFINIVHVLLVALACFIVCFYACIHFAPREAFCDVYLWKVLYK